MAGGIAWWGRACGGAGGMRGEGRVRSRRDGHCSGWYASYWNAFLLIVDPRYLPTAILGSASTFSPIDHNGRN